MSRFLARFYLEVANGTIKIVGFVRWYGLAISAVFVLCLELSFELAFSVSGLVFFFSVRSRSLGYFFRASRNLGILSDQTRIYLKDIVFGPQNI